MNLYIFNKTSNAAVFGIGTYIHELTAALRNNHINVCIININSDKPQIKIEEIDGIRYWHIPEPIPEHRTLKNQKQFDLYHRNIVYLLQSNIIDKKDLVFHMNYLDCKLLVNSLRAAFDCKTVIVVHYLDSVLKLLGNFNRLRMITSQHYNPTNEKDIFAKDSFQKEKELFHSVDKIICLSKHTVDLLQQDYQIDPKKLSLIHNGLSNTNLLLVHKQNVLRNKLHISAHERLILFTGRLHPAKGITFLIRALHKVLKKIPDCRLIIAGNGSFDKFLKECEDIWMRVTWTGFVSKEKLYEFYAIADIGVLPSCYEQCSYVAIEMMMHGLPVICSNTSGLKEMIVNEETGLLAPVTEYGDRVEIDTDMLVEKILYLLENPSERERMGINARKRYERLYSLEVYRRNMIEFYRSLFE